MTSSSPTWMSRVTGSLASLPGCSDGGYIQSWFQDTESPTNPLTIASKALARVVKTEFGPAGSAAFNRKLKGLNTWTDPDPTFDKTARLLLDFTTVIHDELTQTHGGEACQTTRYAKGADLWRDIEGRVGRIANPTSDLERAQLSARSSRQDMSSDDMLKETQKILTRIENVQLGRSVLEGRKEAARSEKKLRRSARYEMARLNGLLTEDEPREKKSVPTKTNTKGSASASSIAAVATVGLAAAGLACYLMSNRNGAGSTWDGESMGSAGRGMRAGMSDYRM